MILDNKYNTGKKPLLLDIGGTFIKCSDGRVIPVDSSGEKESVTAAIKKAVGFEVCAAVAIPGPFDYENGVFLMKHKFASVYGERFTDICGLKEGDVCFEHDVIAMLRGEMARGNAAGYSRVALVTLGTGLGFAMSIDGNIPRNATGSPLVPIYNIPYRDGILEDYASKRGVTGAYARVLGYEPGSVSVKEIAIRAGEGDRCAKAAFAEVGDIIGESIAPLLAEYGIECLLFGGQISRSSALFLPSVTTHLPECVRFAGPVSDFDNATFNGLETIIINKHSNKI